jgi:nitrite reductase/ring-hydroxylating ferredoxin subunit/uncharacterized membrane protein
MNTSSPLRSLQDLLQGKPFRHPLHPILVHAPVGLFVLSLLLDLGSRYFGPDAGLERGALYTLGLALVVAFLAALTGLADWADIRADHPARRVANLHLLLNLVMLALYGLSFFLRLLARDAAVTPWAPLGLSLIGLVVLSVSGYLGGRMIYEDGVAVGRHRRPGDVPLETRRVASGATAGGDYVPVGRLADLPAGQTMRAEVNGYVMALANAGGEVFAFQEYCSHRYGPLSLGKVEAGQVECPWHRSCFDVRTGQVRQGPATVDLRTFPARIVNGLIEVSVPAQRRASEPGQPCAAPAKHESRPREAVGT